MTTVFSWKLGHDTMSRFDAKIKKEALSSVHRRCVEGITSIGGTAGWTGGAFTVANAEIVI